MITHFTITPQCIDCDNPEDTVITITVTNETGEAAEDVLLEVGPDLLGTLIIQLVAQGYGSVTHGTWYEEASKSVWNIPLIDSQETVTTTITLPPGEDDADFCGPESQFLPLTLDATLPAYPTTPAVSATLQLCEDPPPTLQPPGSGRNTPIARVSERNGLTVFFPGETDRTCIQGTCPVAAGGGPAPGPEPECAEVILQGAADVNIEPFDAPGFEWGVTPSFMLIPPGEAQEGIIFEWIAEEDIYFAETGAECRDGEPEEGWTFTLGEPGSPSGCAVVSAVCG